jgi:2,3,4,5-tetrahydropyridine-2-carboxylate N-succinyltransferase
VREAVDHVLAELDAGTLRVAEKKDGQWVVHQWIKKAVLLSFRCERQRADGAGPAGLNFFDKVPTKFDGYTPEQFRAGGVPRGAAGGGAARQLHRHATWC